LSQKAQTHYDDLEDTSRDKVTKFGVTVRYTKKVIEQRRRLGLNLTPGGRLTVNFECHQNTELNRRAAKLQHSAVTKSAL